MSYAALYKGTKPIIRLAFGSGGETPWTRPAWPALADLTSLNNRFTGIYGVDETDSNFVSVLVGTSAGTWTIDWGDGTIESGLTSNVERDHLYDYAAITAGVVGGYKPVVVTVTTQGGNITTFSLQNKHSGIGEINFNQSFAVNWLDVAINATSMTSLQIGGSSVKLDKLQQCKIYGHNLTYMSYGFYNCSSLQSVPLFNTSAVTDMVAMFYGCKSLQSVPLFNTSAVTNMDIMFSGCSSLQSVPLFNTSAVTSMSTVFGDCFSLQSVPLFNTSAVTNMGGMFYNCKSLQSVPLFNTSIVFNIGFMFSDCTSLKNVPLFNTSAVTEMSAMFSNCSSLKNVPLFNTSAVTRIDYMFQNCSSLQNVPLFNTSAVTNMTAMFYGCTSLQSVPLFVTNAVTSMNTMFYNCFSLQRVPLFVTNAVTDMNGMFYDCACLQSVPLFNTSAVTNINNMFFGCKSLAKARTNGIRFSISYIECKLSAASLNDIFTGLGTANGSQTISIGGNPGRSSVTETIATDKGWTIDSFTTSEIW